MLFCVIVLGLYTGYQVRFSGSAFPHSLFGSLFLHLTSYSRIRVFVFQSCFSAQPDFWGVYGVI